ncbi:MAG: hypothetical protein L3K15_05945 [Thermoplasmata archaeon]|nr:hypothetical protein [Thermoplasmata archaeon]
MTGQVIGGSTAYSNHEELGFAARSLAGALPFLLMFGFVWVLLLLVWLENRQELFFLVLMGAFAVAAAGLSILGIRATRSRTPTSIELGPAGLVVKWEGTRGRREAIPFDRITSVDPRHWHWTSGRGAYAQFTPASVQYEQAEATAVKGLTGDQLGDEVVYLTDENAERVRTAMRLWGAGVPVRPEYGPGFDPIPIPPKVPLSRDAAWGEIVDFAANCGRCGRTLESEGERKSGTCTGCSPPPS